MKKAIVLVSLAALMLCLGACGLIGGKPMGSDEVLENPDFVQPQTDIYGEWYANPEFGGEVYVFNEDGTCIINGENCTWNVWVEEDNLIQLECSNGMWIEVANFESGMPMMYCNGVSLVRYPQLWEFCGYWETDRGHGAGLDEYEVQFFINGYTKIEVVQDGDALIFIADCTDGTQQSVRFSYADGYPLAEHTDGNGNVTLYYRPENRPEIDYTELAYQDAVEKLEIAVNGGYIRYEEGSNMVIDGCRAYAYLYGVFEELGDYKDSKEYLSRFKVIEDVLVKRTENEETFTSNLKQYGEHDSLGRRISGMVMDTSELGFYITGYFYNYVYGEDGRISEIITHDGDVETPVAWGIPSYDENGNMTSLDITWISPDGVFSYTSVFTYDEFGRLLTKQIPEPKSFTTNYYWYYYDEDGKLIQVTKDRIKNGKEWPSSREIYEYIYDENGYLIEKREHRNSPGDGVWVWEIINFIYTNDENGLPLSRSFDHGYVLSLVDENGNNAVFEALGTVVSEEDNNRYFDVLDGIFGEAGLTEHHDWLVDTTGYEFTLVSDLYTLEPMGEPFIWNYLYTDVYVYSAEE